MVPYVLHGGDPLSIFKINEYSQRIRDDFKKGGLFEGLVKKYLIDNTHKLTLLAIPDQTIGAKEEQAEKKRLEMLKKSLTEGEKQALIQEALDLKKHQETVQDHAVLPSLGLSDIQRNIEFVDHEIKYIGSKYFKNN